MGNCRNRHRIWIKTIAMVVVCLFTINTICWAYPADSAAMAPGGDNLSRWSLVQDLEKAGILDPAAVMLEAVMGLKYLEDNMDVRFVNAYLREGADRIEGNEKIKFLDVSKEDGTISAKFEIINESKICEIVGRNGVIELVGMTVPEKNLKDYKTEQEKAREERESLISKLPYDSEVYLPKSSIRMCLTRQCLAECRHCYMSSSSETRTHLSVEQLRNFIDEGKRNGLKSFWIAGGEPLLRQKELFEAMEYASEKGVTVVSITSNGFWASTEEKAKSILEKMDGASAHRFSLGISVDREHQKHIPVENLVKLVKAYYGLYRGIPRPKIGLVFPRARLKGDGTFDDLLSSLENEGFVHGAFNVSLGIDGGKLRVAQLSAGGRRLQRILFSLQGMLPGLFKRRHVNKLLWNILPVREEDCITIPIENYDIKKVGRAKELPSIEIINRVTSAREYLKEPFPAADSDRSDRGQLLSLDADNKVYFQWYMMAEHVFPVGDLNNETLGEIIERTNKDPIVRELITRGIRRIYEFAVEYAPGLEDRLDEYKSKYDLVNDIFRDQEMLLYITERLIEEGDVSNAKETLKEDKEKPQKPKETGHWKKWFAFLFILMFTQACATVKDPTTLSPAQPVSREPALPSTSLEEKPKELTRNIDAEELSMVDGEDMVVLEMEEVEIPEVEEEIDLILAEEEEAPEKAEMTDVVKDIEAAPIVEDTEVIDAPENSEEFIHSDTQEKKTEKRLRDGDFPGEDIIVFILTAIWVVVMSVSGIGLIAIVAAIIISGIYGKPHDLLNSEAIRKLPRLKLPELSFGQTLKRSVMFFGVLPLAVITGTVGVTLAGSRMLFSIIREPGRSYFAILGDIAALLRSPKFRTFASIPEGIGIQRENMASRMFSYVEYLIGKVRSGISATNSRLESVCRNLLRGDANRAHMRARMMTGEHIFHDESTAYDEMTYYQTRLHDSTSIFNRIVAGSAGAVIRPLRAIERTLLLIEQRVSVMAISVFDGTYVTMRIQTTEEVPFTQEEQEMNDRLIQSARRIDPEFSLDRITQVRRVYENDFVQASVCTETRRILIERGVFRIMDEVGVAHVIAHEIAHIILGDDSGGNVQGELDADAMAAYIMILAGYDPTSVIQVYEDLGDSPGRRLSRALDEYLIDRGELDLTQLSHPMFWMRIENLKRVCSEVGRNVYDRRSEAITKASELLQKYGNRETNTTLSGYSNMSLLPGSRIGSLIRESNPYTIKQHIDLVAEIVLREDIRDPAEIVKRYRKIAGQTGAVRIRKDDMRMGERWILFLARLKFRVKKENLLKTIRHDVPQIYGWEGEDLSGEGFSGKGLKALNKLKELAAPLSEHENVRIEEDILRAITDAVKEWPCLFDEFGRPDLSEEGSNKLRGVVKRNSIPKEYIKELISSRGIDNAATIIMDRYEHPDWKEYYWLAAYRIEPDKVTEYFDRLLHSTGEGGFKALSDVAPTTLKVLEMLEGVMREEHAVKFSRELDFYKIVKNIMGSPKEAAEIPADADVGLALRWIMFFSPLAARNFRTSDLCRIEPNVLVGIFWDPTIKDNYKETLFKRVNEGFPDAKKQKLKNLVGSMFIKKYGIEITDDEVDDRYKFTIEDLLNMKSVLDSVPGFHRAPSVIRKIKREEPTKRHEHSERERFNSELEGPSGDERKEILHDIERETIPAGSYNHKERVIRIYETDGLRRTLAHEIGHGVHYYVMPSNDREIFVSLYDKSYSQIRREIEVPSQMLYVLRDDYTPPSSARKWVNDFSDFAYPYGALNAKEDFATIYEMRFIDQINFEKKVEKSDLLREKYEKIRAVEVMAEDKKSETIISPLVKRIIKEKYPDAIKQHIDLVTEIAQKGGITDPEEILERYKKIATKTGAVRIRRDDEEKPESVEIDKKSLESLVGDLYGAFINKNGTSKGAAGCRTINAALGEFLSDIEYLKQEIAEENNIPEDVLESIPVPSVELVCKEINGLEHWYLWVDDRFIVDIKSPLWNILDMRYIVADMEEANEIGVKINHLRPDSFYFTGLYENPREGRVVSKTLNKVGENVRRYLSGNMEVHDEARSIVKAWIMKRVIREDGPARPKYIHSFIDTVQRGLSETESMIAERGISFAYEVGSFLKERQKTIKPHEAVPGRHMPTDHEAHDRIVKLLKGAFPMHNVLSEEEDLSPEWNDNAPYTWILDPLCGTTEFEGGSEHFGTDAVCIDMRTMRPVFTVSYTPRYESDSTFDGTMYVATRNGTFVNGKKKVITDLENFSERDAFVIEHRSIKIKGKKAKDPLGVYREYLRKKYDFNDFREGHEKTDASMLGFLVDKDLGMVLHMLKPWDAIRIAHIIAQAGGKVSFIDGTPLFPLTPHILKHRDRLPPLLISPANVHEELLRSIQSVEQPEVVKNIFKITMPKREIKVLVEQEEKRLETQNGDEEFLLKKAEKHLQDYSINMHVDLDAIAARGITEDERKEQLDKNMETLALQIAWYSTFDLKIRFILENDREGEAFGIIREKLENLAGKPGIDREKLMASISGAYTGNNTIKIMLKPTENIKGTEAEDWEFIVGLTDDPNTMGIPVPNYTAASAIGLSQAILRSLAENADGKDNFQKFEAIDKKGKRTIFNRLQRIYRRFDVISEEKPFTMDDLKFMVVGCPKNKKIWANRYALPPIVKDLIDRINEYHAIMQGILQSA